MFGVSPHISAPPPHPYTSNVPAALVTTSRFEGCNWQMRIGSYPQLRGGGQVCNFLSTILNFISLEKGMKMYLI